MAPSLVNAQGLNTTAFWDENRRSDNLAFSTRKPRCPLILPFDDHWVIEEMAVPSTVRYYGDPDYQARINRECNDRIVEAVGVRPFHEQPRPTQPLRIEQVFGCRIEVHEGGTPWLVESIETPEALDSLLDRVERLSDAGLMELITSNGARIEPQAPRPDGKPHTTMPFSRGPATICTSVMGTMQAMYWLVDEPARMDRFFETLGVTLVRYQRLLAQARGQEISGYGILDDNCALFSPPLYERYCLPVMRRLMDTFASAPSARRYQHSDSEMRHLLPLLAQLKLSAVNFGPTIPAEVIRAAMPRTEIHGQIAPMTLRNGSPADIEAEVKRDFAAVGGDGGLAINTAGSISAGTCLSSVRHLMACVERFTRYDTSL